MADQSKNVIIVYVSPAGSTRHVANSITEQLTKLKSSVSVFDLGKASEAADVKAAFQTPENVESLYVGSPVYASRPVPPVLDFLSGLPDNLKVPAIPFVTWGAVCSGIALLEMAQALEAKGMPVIGAAKVAAVHSVMWNADNPLGAGHPNDEDDKMIREWIRRMHIKSSSKAPSGMDIQELAYYPPEARKEMAKVTMAALKERFPKRSIDETLCTQCNVCKELCPTDAIELSPYPVFQDNCILCMNCVKECPESAIKIDLTPLHKMIRGRAAQLNEKPLSQVFY